MHSPAVATSRFERPSTPDDEADRLWRLHMIRVLDTPAEERFDRFTRMARRIFDVEAALITLIDSNRQWFKSTSGIDGTETTRDTSFCGHAIMKPDLFVVPDARRDERFAGNPYVIGPPFVRFYAACPIPATDGSALGTLCIIDTEPRELDDEDRALLRDLGSMAGDELIALDLATVDELTGLSNRASFMALADKAVRHARAHDAELSVLFIDMDGFKAINDRFGHDAGDQALRDTADCLRHALRSEDLIARVGGDEFCVLLPGSSASQAARVAERIQDEVERHNARAGRRYTLAGSIGQASLSTGHRDLNELLRDADEAMYAAKRRSR